MSGSIFGYFSLDESGKVVEPSERRRENCSGSEELNLKITGFSQDNM